MKKKLVFLDIDGTLIGENETLYKSTVDAVKKAIENGHRLFICSGREKNIVSKKLFDIGLLNGVFSAGANVICDGKEIFHQSFTPQEYDKIISVLLRHEIMVILETKEHELLLEPTYFPRFAHFKEWLTSIGGEICNEVPKGLSDVDKFVYTGSDCSTEKLQNEFGDICKIVTMSYDDDDQGGEIMLPHINKAFGIQKVLDYYGMSAEDTIGIGDGANDIEMLKFCGLGIAMGNGDERAKKAADMVTDRIESDGLYKAFELAGLI